MGDEMDITMRELLDGISELVYIVDPNTYEILYVNASGKAIFDIEDYEGRRCYEVFRDKNKPCASCEVNPKNGKANLWEQRSPKTGRHYFLKGRPIRWNGRDARIEIAFDLTEQEDERRVLKSMLDAEKLVMQCVRQLHRETDLVKGVNALLAQLGQELGAERTYVFEIANGRMSNTFEWCGPGVKPQINNLQALDIQYIARWEVLFKQGEGVVIEDMETLRETDQEEYEALSRQSIKSLVAAPLERGGELVGFVGVDNPAVKGVASIGPMLSTLSYFLMATLSRIAGEQRLRALSFADALTGLYNRNRFMQDTEKTQGCEGPLGVAYMDLNGLKKINDTLGHAKGDEALIVCAEALQEIFPFAGIYRIGGDEFVVLQLDVAEADFSALLERLRGRFGDGSQYHVAIGGMWAPNGTDVEYMLHLADVEMYEDKRRYYRTHNITSRYRQFGGEEEPIQGSQLWKEYNMLMSAMHVSVSKHLLHSDFTILWANDFFYAMTGYTKEEYNDQFHGTCSAYFQTEPAEYNRLCIAAQEAFHAGKPGYETTLSVPRRDGTRMCLNIVGTFTEERSNGLPVVYAVFTDITELVEQRGELLRLAFEDDVTGGRNRRSFEQDAGRAVRSSAAGTYALVSMDIQRFKVINDLFGIEAGDATLRYIYSKMVAQLSEDEFAARLSSDTFNLLLKAEVPERLEQRIATLVEDINSFNLNVMHKYLLIMTAGIYYIKDPYLPMTQLQDRANVARKQIMETLGTQLCRCRFYNNRDRLQMAKEKDIENRMEDALHMGEFVVYLQPKQDLQTGAVVGGEALVRWKDPKVGLIPPDEFIPLFERNGFIVELDLFVFEQVCLLLRKWVAQGRRPVPISVNMSRVHLRDGGYLARYEEIRRRHGIPPELLEIEVTETVVLENPQLLACIIDEFHRFGYRCSMDDFGSGYSSLNVLKSIQVDTLKLDRAFFSSKSVDDPREAAIICGVVELAHRLEMETVAEGVETHAQADFLRGIGCGQLQGFLFSRPVPPEEFEALVF